MWYGLDSDPYYYDYGANVMYDDGQVYADGDANLDDEVNFETFFKKCKLNPNAHLITGVVCGYRVEEIENPFLQKTRYLDKLIDELAKGRKMEKILRVDK